MRKVITYVSEDNRTFTSEEGAALYEEYLHKVDNLLPKFKELSGEEYYQHDLKRVTSARKQFCDLLGEYYKKVNNKWLAGICEECGKGERHWSHLTYYMADAGDGLFRHTEYRFRCIDENGREFQQPYYVEHPYEAPNCINL